MITCALPCDQKLPRQSFSSLFAVLVSAAFFSLSAFASSVSLRTRLPAALSLAPMVLAMAEAIRYYVVLSSSLRTSAVVASFVCSRCDLASFFLAGGGRCAIPTNASELLKKETFLIQCFSKLLKKKFNYRTISSELLKKKPFLSYRHVIAFFKSSTSTNSVPT